jgi:hypothetical protein
MFDSNSRLTLMDNSTVTMAEMGERDWTGRYGVLTPTGAGLEILQLYEEQAQPCVTITTAAGRRFTCGAKSKLLIAGGGYAVAGSNEPLVASIMTVSGPEAVTDVAPAEARELWCLITGAPHCALVDGVWFVTEPQS